MELNVNCYPVYIFASKKSMASLRMLWRIVIFTAFLSISYVTGITEVRIFLSYFSFIDSKHSQRRHGDIMQSYSYSRNMISCCLSVSGNHAPIIFISSPSEPFLQPKSVVAITSHLHRSIFLAVPLVSFLEGQG